ncbi:hypothetical protein FE257_005816 [Aspergillus nanangensis]|uniref:Uncharacterized protein n=1 Tax=Aspergillus nanangensis TaxID=2582783 RepID=A0AAD4GNT6_ASPNN|nr:hypothetical protein FE257_005816 [Aspergillus nanangensis]
MLQQDRFSQLTLETTTSFLQTERVLARLRHSEGSASKRSFPGAEGITQPESPELRLEREAAPLRDYCHWSSESARRLDGLEGNTVGQLDVTKGRQVGKLGSRRSFRSHGKDRVVLPPPVRSGNRTADAVHGGPAVSRLQVDGGRTDAERSLLGDGHLRRVGAGAGWSADEVKAGMGGRSRHGIARNAKPDRVDAGAAAEPPSSTRCAGATLHGGHINQAR